jgi:hypothetical protein
MLDQTYIGHLTAGVTSAGLERFSMRTDCTDSATQAASKSRRLSVFNAVLLMHIETGTIIVVDVMMSEELPYVHLKHSILEAS